MKNISFKIIFRSWWRNKTFTVISILSLAVGIACANLLAAFVIHEYNMESENPNKDKMVVVKQAISGAGMTAFNTVSQDITSQLLEHVPELDRVCCIHPYFMVSYCKVGENFFKRLFGGSDPIGETVQMLFGPSDFGDEKGLLTFTVSAVVKDNSQAALGFDALFFDNPSSGLNFFLFKNNVSCI